MSQVLSAPNVFPCDQENIPPSACTPQEVDLSERRGDYKGDENTENSQDTTTYAVKLLEKVLKEKNLEIVAENRRESLQSRNVNILGERQVNVERENHSQNESNPVSVQKKESLAHLMSQKKLQKYTIKQLLHISKSTIDFGSNYPGQMIDESLDIVNKTNQNLVIQITLDCENPDFQDTEEYVYSIRRSHLFDFNDKHYLIMAPYSSASFKVTLKVPLTKKSCDNKGSLQIGIQGLQATHKINLESQIRLPKVTCPKALYHKPSGCKMVRLAVKEGKKQECKLPFKNEGDVPLTLDFSFYNDKNSEGNSENLDCCVYPATLTIPANGTSTLHFVTRTAKSGGSRNSVNKQKTMEKKVLLGKVKDTNLIYSFNFCVETY